MGVILFCCSASCFGQLEDAAVRFVNISANRMVYDPIRDRLYVTVGSSIGFPNGNSIHIVDPETLNIIDTFFIGSEPDIIQISDDAKRVYVGLAGGRAFRFWEPGTGVLSPPTPLFLEAGFTIRAGTAEDLAISKLDNSVVVVSIDDVTSTGDGNLRVFQAMQPLDKELTFADANSILFLNESHFVSYNNDSSGFDLKRWKFCDNILTLEDKGVVNTGFGTVIEESGGLIYGTDGRVVDPFDFSLIAQLTSGAVEPVDSDEAVYTYRNNVLRLYESAGFTEVDSVSLPGASNTFRQLILTGPNRLSFLGTDGSVGHIKNIPATYIPGILLGDVNRDGAIDLLDVGPFIDRIVDGQYQTEADLNADCEVNLLDVALFIDLLTP